MRSERKFNLIAKAIAWGFPGFIRQTGRAGIVVAGRRISAKVHGSLAFMSMVDTPSA
jgi:hypothetical protein